MSKLAGTYSRHCWIAAALGTTACSVVRRSANGLVLSLAEDRGELDPAKLIAQDWTPLAQTYKTLVIRQEDGTIGPGLTSCWQGLNEVVWQFHLRPGVAFHDGTVLTASLASDSLQRSAALRGSGQDIPLLRGTRPTITRCGSAPRARFRRCLIT